MARLVFTRSRSLEEALQILIRELGLGYIDGARVYGAVSRGSRSTAYARIWGLPSPFVRLGICRASYVIELVYENARSLGCEELLAVLVHELLHIPRSFSGGLRGHGEWSRWSRIRSLVRALPVEAREKACRLAREALREAERG